MSSRKTSSVSAKTGQGFSLAMETFILNEAEQATQLR